MENMRIATADWPARPGAEQIQQFAGQVEKLSHGQLRIEPVWEANGEEHDDWDQVVARKVVEGEMEMGMIPARTWDTEGVFVAAPPARTDRARNNIRGGTMTMRALTRTFVCLAGVPCLLVLFPGTGQAAQAEVWTIVERNVTTSQSFPDDICGARAVTETLTNRVQVNHLTANSDGSFHFVDFETGTLVADYEDPNIPDQTFRRTNTEVFNLSPGGTFTATETLHQSDGTLSIRSVYHLTVVNGQPVVEKEAGLVRGCP